LAEILASEPIPMLGEESAQGSTALLLKLLDSGENLSLQIHPSRDYPALKDGETGKAECWYVIDHEQGAGIYFGLSTGVNESRMRSALERGEDISKLLHFVPVNQGDLFVIEPGTPHAIGGGVTLLEPQYVAPGCRGITYRYWDWNRRYDAAGRQAAEGQPRQLHIEEALAVTDWNRSIGESLLATCHVASGAAALEQNPVLEHLCGPEGEAAVRSSCIRATRLTGTGRNVLPSWNALRSLTVVEGAVVLGARSDRFRVHAGQTVAIPACNTNLRAQLEQCHALICAVYTPRQRR
jgi:mannose-6-phosphate isomerase class I